MRLYGIDTHDPRLYDLVVHIDRLSTDDAADLICRAVRWDRFQTTPESQQAMDDLLLGARVKATLVEHEHWVDVAAHQGIVYIALEGRSADEKKAIQDTVLQVPGVKRIDVNKYPFMTRD